MHIGLPVQWWCQIKKYVICSVNFKWWFLQYSDTLIEEDLVEQQLMSGEMIRLQEEEKHQISGDLACQ